MAIARPCHKIYMVIFYVFIYIYIYFISIYLFFHLSFLLSKCKVPLCPPWPIRACEIKRLAPSMVWSLISRFYCNVRTRMLVYIKVNRCWNFSTCSFWRKFSSSSIARSRRRQPCSTRQQDHIDGPPRFGPKSWWQSKSWRGEHPRPGTNQPTRPAANYLSMHESFSVNYRMDARSIKGIVPSEAAHRICQHSPRFGVTPPRLRLGIMQCGHMLLCTLASSCSPSLGRPLWIALHLPPIADTQHTHFQILFVKLKSWAETIAVSARSLGIS